MKIVLGTVRQSPFVGIFCIATEKRVFVPAGISKKEEKALAGLFGVEMVKASVANSPLLGVLAAANSRGMLLGSVAEESEERELKQAGIKVKRLEGITAVGNLLAANDSRGVCSSVFSEKAVKGIEGFLGIELARATVAGSDVVGASIVATNKGFLLNKMAQEKEARAIEKHFGVEGMMATANSGDHFVGNSVVANSEAAMAGSATTGFELARIDEGLRGQ